MCWCLTKFTFYVVRSALQYCLSSLSYPGDCVMIAQFSRHYGQRLSIKKHEETKMAERTKSAKIKHIVADSAAFLKNAPLHEMCENVYTIEDVVNEIRDATTRQRLSVLPYNIQFRQPSTEALHAVSEFAKLTGDFRSLSAVDLRVLALTYQLEKEHCGIDHIKTRPTKQVEITQGFTGKAVPGFFVEKEPKKDENEENELNKEERENSAVESNRLDDKQVVTNTDQQHDCSEHNSNDGNEDSRVDHSRTKIGSATSNDENSESRTAEITTGMETLTINNVTLNDSRDNDEGFEENNDDVDNDDDLDSDSDDNDNDDDDVGGWITPDNINHVKGQMGKGTLDAAPANVIVGCLTTDFAMQNVLIQMGFHVISLDGMLIREAQSYVRKCYACFRVTSQLEKKFCPSCGNSTLVRVSVSVDENGVTHYQLPNRKKPFNIRGKKYPIPLPKGGRHSENPVLCEDQPRGQHRLPRNKDNMSVFDPDYVARGSPFAAKDVTSRASQLGYHLKGGHNQNRRNPNEVKKKSARRKKK